MTHTITELGPKQLEFLATVSAEGRKLFDFERAARFWGSRQYAANELSLLESKGWVERLERGSYMLVPLEAGLDRVWSEDSLAIGTFLAPKGAAAYWSAVRYWNWTTQLPLRVLFLTPERRARPQVKVLGVSYRFITLKPEHLFGVHETRDDSLRVRVTDRERTVLDMMDRPDLCGGLAEVADALRTAWPAIDRDRVSAYLRRFPSRTVPKRLGYLVEHLGLDVSNEQLVLWRSMIGKGFTLLERGGPAKGPLLRRWNLRLNSEAFSQYRGSAE